MAKTIKVQRGAKFRVKGNPAQTSQAFSAATSVRQVPAMIRALVNTRSLEAGHTNVDIGGGRFDDATDLLATVGVRSFVVDSGNRSQEHNRNVLAMLDDGRADSVTIANVLNVIPDSGVRREVLELARNVVRPDGRVYIDCYAGSGKEAGKGVGRSTSKGWQEYRSLASYLPEVLAVFPTAKIVTIGGNRMIVASKAHHRHQQPMKGNAVKTKKIANYRIISRANGQDFGTIRASSEIDALAGFFFKAGYACYVDKTGANIVFRSHDDALLCGGSDRWIVRRERKDTKSRAKPNSHESPYEVGMRVGSACALRALARVDRGDLRVADHETLFDVVSEHARIAAEESAEGAVFYDEPEMNGGHYTSEDFEAGVYKGIEREIDRREASKAHHHHQQPTRRANPAAKSNTGAKHLVAVSAGKVPQYVFNTDHWKLVERSAGNIVTRYNLSGPRGAKWRIDADTSFSSSDPRRFTYYRVS